MKSETSGVPRCILELASRGPFINSQKKWLINKFLMSSSPFVHKWEPKRQYHKTYKCKETVEEVFCKFEDVNLNLADISRMSGVPYKTIQYWHMKYKEDKEYRPGSLLGRHKRHFTKAEEENISEFITTEYLHNGISMHRKHLQSTLSDCWKSVLNFSTFQHLLQTSTNLRIAWYLEALNPLRHQGSMISFFMSKKAFLNQRQQTYLWNYGTIWESKQCLMHGVL